MSSPPLSTTELVMPADFAVVPYEAVSKRIESRNTNDPAWVEYAGAWNAVRYRFHACVTHEEAFTRSIKQAGDAPPQPERYVQERELFNFFVNGLATIESLCYGLYTLGAIVDGASFPMQKPYAITPQSTRKKFAARFPGEAVAGALARLVDDPQFIAWNNIRNVLAHRSAPGRTIFASVGSVPTDPTPAEWKGMNMVLDPQALAARREWLAATIRDLLIDADAFTSRHLPKAAT